ncbi:MAG: VOC family protein [Anaerolineae bacterium]
MREFDHIGLPTTEKHPDEMFVESTRVWVTNPANSPQMVEYLRYEPDSPVTGPLRTLPHIAFRVDNLEKEIEGAEVVLGPFHPTPDLRVVFVHKDGVVWEFMESKVGKDWHKGGSS